MSPALVDLDATDDTPAVQALFASLKAALPELRIVSEGTNKTFDPAHNRRWLEVTRPIIEAFFHARYSLEMAVTYGQQLTAPPRMLPSGWAALLYLYRLRLHATAATICSARGGT